jgi:hypothetical protein
MHILFANLSEGFDGTSGSASVALAGFKVTTIATSESVAPVVEAIAKTGGRLDAGYITQARRARNKKSVEDYAKEIRAISDDVSFLGVVRANAIPIVGAYPNAKDDAGRAIPWYVAFDSTVTNQLSGNEIRSSITKWREDLLDELDYVGFSLVKTESGLLDVSPTLARKRQSGKILTEEATPRALKKGQFLLLPADLASQSAPLKELVHRVNHCRQIATERRMKPENVLQEFFDLHPHMLMRGEYDEHFPKPELVNPQTGELRYPDYILKANVGVRVRAAIEILDLKQPAEKVIVAKTHRARASKALYDAMSQLDEYRELILSKQFAELYVQKFGVLPRNPKMAVLIGRSQSEEEVVEVQNALGERFSDVQVLTYDEIIRSEAAKLAANENLASYFAD